MSIIIKGMEMPKSCADCHDADLPTAIAWLEAKCPWAHGIIDPGVYDLRQDRHPNCPLHELPEHGDLIDRSALMKEHAKAESAKYGNLFVAGDNRFIHRFLEAPVVVPAERSGE